MKLARQTPSAFVEGQSVERLVFHRALNVLTYGMDQKWFLPCLGQEQGFIIEVKKPNIQEPVSSPSISSTVLQILGH